MRSASVLADRSPAVGHPCGEPGSEPEAQEPELRGLWASENGDSFWAAGLQQM